MPSSGLEPKVLLYAVLAPMQVRMVASTWVLARVLVLSLSAVRESATVQESTTVQQETLPAQGTTSKALLWRRADVAGLVDGACVVLMLLGSIRTAVLVSEVAPVQLALVSMLSALDPV